MNLASHLTVLNIKPYWFLKICPHLNLLVVRKECYTRETKIVFCTLFCLIHKVGFVRLSLHMKNFVFWAYCFLPVIVAGLAVQQPAGVLGAKV